jgi:twitching motility protein PilJ
VSHQIASLVQNISGSAREQNKAASAITQNMDVLREVSARTKQSTTATSSSISKLSELASQLRRTVSGFTLPNEGAQAGAAAQDPIGGPPSDGLSPDLEQEFTDDDLTSHQEAVGEHR